jgi:anthranilate synthase/aminodeoxychorismate synthase-like glutamine amidotransferase
VSLQAVRAFLGAIPILGVCLGHQVLCEALGARVVHASRLMHGRTSRIHHDGRGLFAGIDGPFHAARYHSLIVDVHTLPPELEPCAESELGELMAVRHVSGGAHGLQFHPESFMTEHGARMLQSFVELSSGRESQRG